MFYICDIYAYYTDRKWRDLQNYDLAVNVSSLGVEKTATMIKDIILKKYN